MSASDSEVAKVARRVRDKLGADPRSWDRWPGGWPDDIEKALVDAVYSARAQYKTKRGKGVHPLVVKWADRRQRAQFTVDALAAEIEAESSRKWAQDFGSSQISPGRPATAPGGRSKAATVCEAAGALAKNGVHTAADVLKNGAGAKGVLLKVDGIGEATANYFLMLLGAPGVKPDRMIHRFIREALGLDKSVTNRHASEIVTATAREFGVEPHELDHAIWRWESNRAAGVDVEPGSED